jgi:hypothetical protein
MDTDQSNAKKYKQRLEAIFRGAFAGPPTPLKDIPKRNGESRGNGTKKRTKRNAAKPR